MKRSFFALALAVVCGVAMPSQRAHAQNQHEMTQSAAKDFEKADAELNTVYKKVLATLDAEGKEKLVKAQRAWVAYRDAQAIYEGDSERGGSMEPMIHYGAQARMTKERVTLLRRSFLADSPDQQ